MPTIYSLSLWIIDIVNSSMGPDGIAGLWPINKSAVTEASKEEEQDRNPTGMAVFPGYKKCGSTACMICGCHCSTLG